MEQKIAQLISNLYGEYRKQMHDYTVLAANRFSHADWNGQRLAVRQRIKFHDDYLHAVGKQIAQHAGHEITAEHWQAIFSQYDKLAGHALDSMAVSFFDAIGRLVSRGAARIYLNSLSPKNEEFSESEMISIPWQGKGALAQLLSAIHFSNQIKSLRSKPGQLLKEFEVNHQLEESSVLQACPELFYRNKHAYMVGRVVTGPRTLAFALCFNHIDDAIELNAVLFGEDALKNIFSFSRSYFLVHARSLEATVNFLRLLMPSKPEAQLYINLGYQFHGRELLLHTVEGQAKNLPEQFVEAPGTRGLVMVVITQRSSEFVIKLIRDECKPPKNTLPEEVHQKYAFVAAQDRVGRLADAQRVDFLRLPRYSVPHDLLAMLQLECAKSCELTEEWLLLHSVYVERKLVPLNIFMESNTGPLLYNALSDFGHAIREMAMSNIFAGDLLIKNFGVTPEGRVIFYDYDEVVPVTSCHFRLMPQPNYDEQEYENENWFVVKEEDVFPEEWPKFLLPDGPFRAFCKQEHADIFRASFWNEIKNMHLRGEIVDLQPYQPNLH